MGIDYPLSIRNNWLCLSARRDDTLTRGEPGVKQHRLAGEGGENDSRFSVDASQLDHPQRAADGMRSMRVGARRWDFLYSLWLYGENKNQRHHLLLTELVKHTDFTSYKK